MFRGKNATSPDLSNNALLVSKRRNALPLPPEKTVTNLFSATPSPANTRNETTFNVNLASPLSYEETPELKRSTKPVASRNHLQPQSTAHEDPKKTVTNTPLEKKATQPPLNLANEKVSNINLASPQHYKKVPGFNNIIRAIASGSLNFVEALFSANYRRISNSKNTESWKELLCHVNAEGESLILLAARKKNVAILNFIWNEIKKAFLSDLSVLKKIIEKPAIRKYSILRFAIKEGETEIFKVLLEISQKIMGTNTDEFLDFLIDQDTSGDTIISDLCRFNHLEIFKLTMDVTQSVSKEKKEEWFSHRNNNGFTPLNIAASEGHVEIIKYLFEMHDKLLSSAPIIATLQRSQFIESAGHHKFTSLNCAIQGNHILAVRTLIEKIKDSELIEDNLLLDVNNHSVLISACYHSQIDMLLEVLSIYKNLFSSNPQKFDNELIRKGKNNYTPLNTVFAERNPKMIASFLDYLEKEYKGADDRLKVILSDHSSHRILNCLVLKKDVANVKTFLALMKKLFISDAKPAPGSCADNTLEKIINHCKYKKSTPLDNALKSRNGELVRMIREFHAFVFQKNNPNGKPEGVSSTVQVMKGVGNAAAAVTTTQTPVPVSTQISIPTPAPISTHVSKQHITTNMVYQQQCQKLQQQYEQIKQQVVLASQQFNASTQSTQQPVVFVPQQFDPYTQYTQQSVNLTPQQFNPYVQYTQQSVDFAPQQFNPYGQHIQQQIVPYVQYALQPVVFVLQQCDPSNQPIHLVNTLFNANTENHPTVSSMAGASFPFVSSFRQ